MYQKNWVELQNILVIMPGLFVYQGRNDSTAPHELMHAMGLEHTFDNDGKFTYKYKNTDNIMDYTHQDGKQKFTTNKWQWKILNSNIQ